MDTRNPFGYDQVDNAWAAKNIVVDHQLTFIGMPAKANSGIYIGPAYYYFIAFFYWLTNLNPIASGIAAGVTSIFTFWVIFFVSRKMFSKEVALIAVIINTFTMQSIAFDRVQVPINFIPAISLLIFYFLYKIIQGNAKYIPILALLVGFFFNIHFTAIFFPIIIALSLPFFPKKKETIKYFLIAIPAFLIWVLPSTISEFQKKTDYSSFGSYLELNYHGFHLRRVFQLAEDGLIQFNMYLFNEKLNWLKFVSIPIFFLVYLYKSVSRKKLLFCYLVILWFIVPWFGFATYSGEITDYYFSINRFIALMI
ncbi:glycosyltransferase family 39 protein, partial [Patescibacteria group bacterium]|nr:glycosyltransferase family 39 protein [Patescibacteria group bacterium]